MTIQPLKKPVFSKVSEIDPNSHGLNLVLKVVRVAEESQKGFTEIVAGDDTGLVTLRLTAEQIELAIVNTTVVLRNARVVMIQGRIRLQIDKWGKFNTAELSAAFEPNYQIDVSAVEYQLVDF